MLILDTATVNAIVAHARQDHPDEACGIVAGPAGTDRAERKLIWIPPVLVNYAGVGKPVLEKRVVL